jgi:transposase
MDLTDEQWAVVAPLIPAPPRRFDCRGRPRREDRAVLNGVLWVLRTGAAWHDLPARYPSYPTCYRRYRQWRGCGALDQIISALVDDLLARGDLGPDPLAAMDPDANGPLPRTWQTQVLQLLRCPHAADKRRRLAGRAARRRSTISF